MNSHSIFYYGYSQQEEGFFESEEIEEERTIKQIPQLRNIAALIEECKADNDRTRLIADKKLIKIKKSDVLAITYSFICSKKGHFIEPYCGMVSIITPESGIVVEKVYLGYCNDCGVYYIFRRDYDSLSRKGKLLCKVIDSDSKKVISDANFSFGTQSILAEMGYNVQTSENLSSEERQRIIKKAIEDVKKEILEVDANAAG